MQDNIIKRFAKKFGIPIGHDGVVNVYGMNNLPYNRPPKGFQAPGYFENASNFSADQARASAAIWSNDFCAGPVVALVAYGNNMQDFVDDEIDAPIGDLFFFDPSSFISDTSNLNYDDYADYARILSRFDLEALISCSTLEVAIVLSKNIGWCWHYRTAGIVNPERGKFE